MRETYFSVAERPPLREEHGGLGASHLAPALGAATATGTLAFVETVTQTFGNPNHPQMVDGTLDIVQVLAQDPTDFIQMPLNLLFWGLRTYARKDVRDLALDEDGRVDPDGQAKLNRKRKVRNCVDFTLGAGVSQIIPLGLKASEVYLLGQGEMNSLQIGALFVGFLGLLQMAADGFELSKLFRDKRRALRITEVDLSGGLPRIN